MAFVKYKRDLFSGRPKTGEFYVSVGGKSADKPNKITLNVGLSRVFYDQNARNVEFLFDAAERKAAIVKSADGDHVMSMSGKVQALICCQGFIVMSGMVKGRYRAEITANGMIVIDLESLHNLMESRR